MSKIIIYTDGGCRGNAKSENIGGFGVVLQYGEHEKEMYGGERNTTNNIQELKGAITGLEALKTTHIPVELYSDSKYVVEGVNDNWVRSWRRNGWKNSSNKTPKNLELWVRLMELVTMQEDIKFIWVKGHASNEGNNRADQLANKAMDEVI
jgi:ribonuclease HI